jgi:hypothetical protein
MPLLAIPTTVAQIQDAFTAALLALTPRTTRGQSNEWKYFARDHAPAIGCRLFRYEWDGEGITPGGFMWNGGASVDVTCSIITDYGGISAQEIDSLAHDDHQQLADVLDALRLTTNGLRRVRLADWALDARSSRDQARVVHQFLVTYLQAKAS